MDTHLDTHVGVPMCAGILFLNRFLLTNFFSLISFPFGNATFSVYPKDVPIILIILIGNIFFEKYISSIQSLNIFAKIIFSEILYIFLKKYRTSTLDQRKWLIESFISTLLCGTSERFFEGLYTTYNFFKVPQRIVKMESYVKIFDKGFWNTGTVNVYWQHFLRSS